jgi:hypothetical protein
MADYRTKTSDTLRVLFCIGVQQTFFDEEADLLSEIIPAIQEAFADLRGRFGVQVLGTLDDDQIMVGNAPNWPWTAYVLADVPDLDTVAAVCNIVRDTPIGSHRLWRYLRIEARVGRELFFANA